MAVLSVTVVVTPSDTRATTMRLGDRLANHRPVRRYWRFPDAQAMNPALGDHLHSAAQNGAAPLRAAREQRIAD
jgi:hypothetical protein